jgi:hypothetical protein
VAASNWRKSSYSGGNTDCVEVDWRKSSYSSGNTDCVEVAHGAGAVGVRDSKNVAGPDLAFTQDEWLLFTAAVRSHRSSCR